MDGFLATNRDRLPGCFGLTSLSAIGLAGWAIATQVACAVFGAICGSNTATAATMGAIAMPEMKKYHYDDSLASASVAAGGVLGVLIPPSVIFIVYGIATEQSVGKLFLAGILPGLLLMMLYIAVIIFLTLKSRQLGPAGPRATWGERIRALKGGLLEALAVFALSMGGLFKGWFTPTEAGAVGAAGVMAVALVSRSLKWEGIKNSLIDTTKTTAMIMLIVAGAMIFGRFIAISRIPFELATWAGQIPLPPSAAVGLILLICLILGCFIDALALVLLTVPIFYPVVVDTLGYCPIWFGSNSGAGSSMGVITPRWAIERFCYKRSGSRYTIEVIYKASGPFSGHNDCYRQSDGISRIATFLPLS